MKLYDAMGISSEHPSGKCYRGLTQIKSVFHLDTEDLHECNGIHGIPDGRQSGKIAKGWNIFHNSFKYMLNVCLVSERYTLEALIHLAFILQYKKDQTKFGRYVYRWLLRPTPHIASILNFCLHFANDILWKYSDVYSPQMYTLHRRILPTDVYSPQIVAKAMAILFPLPLLLCCLTGRLIRCTCTSFPIFYIIFILLCWQSAVQFTGSSEASSGAVAAKNYTRSSYLQWETFNTCCSDKNPYTMLSYAL